MPENLKPVTIMDWGTNFFGKREFQQNLLLKALKVTQDPKELRRMLGVKSVADVYRTLDKLSIRREYHKVLGEKGLTLEYISNEIKDIIEDSKTSSSVKLKALMGLLKSIGLDRYEKLEDTGKSWEELLLKSEEPKALPGKYEVIEPEIPEEERKKLEKDKKVSEGLYG